MEQLKDKLQDDRTREFLGLYRMKRDYQFKKAQIVIQNSGVYKFESSRSNARKMLLASKSVDFIPQDFIDKRRNK